VLGAVKSVLPADGHGGVCNRNLVSHGCIVPMCNMLESAEPATVEAILEGMENILRVGDVDARRNWGWNAGVNPFIQVIKQEGGDALLAFTTTECDLACKHAHILYRLGLLPAAGESQPPPDDVMALHQQAPVEETPLKQAPSLLPHASEPSSHVCEIDDGTTNAQQ
jgi:hypothetical protein